MNKVFCIGMHKAGTSSLDQFAYSVGMNSCHETNWSRSPLSQGVLRCYDFFSDGGAHYWNNDFEFGGNHDLRGLGNSFPECKFILQYRGIRSWMVSKMLHAGWRAGVDVVDRPEELIHENWRDVRSRKALRAWVENRIKYHESAINFLHEGNHQYLVVDVTADDAAMEKVSDFVLGVGMWKYKENFSKFDRVLNKFKSKKSVPAVMPRANESKTKPEDRAHCQKIVEVVTSDLDYDVENFLLSSRTF